jgi:cyclophilin family peptidyl-prolyl cis-trans isomerase
MRRITVIIAVIFTGLSLSMCSQQSDKETMIIIHTDYGDITAKLYNETPIHRDNFITLVKKGWYNNSPFHRVIQNFMIQGGQSASGELGPGYQIDAEFNPELYHKKGALAAARQPDHINPEKKSSGSQFYIVQGKKYSDAELDAI